MTAQSDEEGSSLLPLWHGLLGPACTVSRGGRYPQISTKCKTIDLLQITFALPIHLQRHKLTLGSVVIASSSTVPETLGSVVTSKDFLSELNWREKHEDIEEKRKRT